MPARTAKIVSQSTRVARSPRNQAPNRAIHTGAEYWIRIALAAVVSLLATMNRPVVAASDSAAPHSAPRMPPNDGRRIAYSAAAQIAERADQIAIGFHVTYLMRTPAVLQNTPHRTRR